MRCGSRHRLHALKVVSSNTQWQRATVVSLRGRDAAGTRQQHVRGAVSALPRVNAEHVLPARSVLQRETLRPWKHAGDGDSQSSLRMQPLCARQCTRRCAWYAISTTHQTKQAGPLSEVSVSASPASSTHAPPRQLGRTTWAVKQHCGSYASAGAHGVIQTRWCQP